MKRLLSLFLSILLLLPLFSCSMQEEPLTEGLRLYGMNAEQSRLGGDVITAQFWFSSSVGAVVAQVFWLGRHLVYRCWCRAVVPWCNGILCY